MMVVTYSLFLGFFAAMLWAFCLADLWSFATACRCRKGARCAECMERDGLTKPQERKT